MNLVGDPDGVEQLRKVGAERKEFLKFLITEAKTSLARRAEFKGEDGRRWVISYNAQVDELSVAIKEQ